MRRFLPSSSYTAAVHLLLAGQPGCPPRLAWPTGGRRTRKLPAGPARRYIPLSNMRDSSKYLSALLEHSSRAMLCTLRAYRSLYKGGGAWSAKNGYMWTTYRDDDGRVPSRRPWLVFNPREDYVGGTHSRRDGARRGPPGTSASRRPRLRQILVADDAGRGYNSKTERHIKRRLPAKA